MNKQKGVGLIEVLVSLVVIAIGLLGILGMQTQALKQSQETYLFNNAHFMANTLFERMRANRNYILSLEADGDAATKSYYHKTFTEVEALSTSAVNGQGCRGIDPVLKTALCTPAQMATFDMFWWLRLVKVNIGFQQGGIMQPQIEFTDASVGSAKSVIATVRIRIANESGKASVTYSAREGLAGFEEFVFETRL